MVADTDSEAAGTDIDTAADSVAADIGTVVPQMKEVLADFQEPVEQVAAS